ncbi:MAG: FAD-dependent oxidoreductase [Geodermatophilaceae bacterium]|nr:FAD-dependent oxidoreductase [Geodermatophilaceae bacterium]
MDVAVVGAGVLGLTCAVRLAEAGHRVKVTTAAAPADTTSAVAAALWYPYRAWPAESVTRWAARSRTVFAELAADCGTGVLLRAGRELLRSPAPHPWWAAAVPDLRRLTPEELPPGFVDGFGFTAPVIDMSRYLAWLLSRAGSLGVSIVVRRLSTVDDAEGDVVVNCTGLGSREFAGDQSLVPVRGQVVRLANPGLTEWLLDEDDPAGMTYVVPRHDDVVCGGTADVGADSGDPDRAVEAAILSRARALVPALVGAPVVSRGIGYRPTRPTVRVEVEDTARRPLVHCYGHGGAGVTLSWGCADDVVALLPDDQRTIG